MFAASGNAFRFFIVNVKPCKGINYLGIFVSALTIPRHGIKGWSFQLQFWIFMMAAGLPSLVRNKRTVSYLRSTEHLFLGY